MSENEMFKDVDEEPVLNPIKPSARLQDQKEVDPTPNKPQINQPYNPLNFEISEEDSNPWTNPSLLIYSNANSNSSQIKKTLNVDFFNKNQANESLLPLYIRPVSNFFPVSNATRELTNLPSGLIITPGQVDQKQVPVTDLTGSSLIRCPRCSAHISPYCTISPDGKHWKCGICGNDTIFLSGNVHVKEKPKNESLQEYTPLNTKSKEIKTIADLYSQNSSDFQDSMISHEDRLEISSPVIDIIAPRNYNVYEKVGPSFLFIFDLSYNSLIHCYAQSVATSVLSVVNEISDDTYISLITIDDNLTLYDLKKNNRTTYPELDPDILKDELTFNVCKLKDDSGNCRNHFISILKEIQNMQIDPSKSKSKKVDQGNCIGSAFEVVPHILKDIGGIVLAFIFGPCNVGPRAVSKRSPDDMLNETLLLQMPKDAQSSSFYGGIARLFARSMISLHLFAASDLNNFVDLAVIGIPSGLTGGRCHFFNGFTPTNHFSELHREIYRTLTMKYFWNATLQLRTSSSLVIRRIYANCQIKSPNSLTIPSIAMEDSFAFEFGMHMHITTDTLNFQFELEWNDEQRRRMIRVFNFFLPVTDDPLRILKHVDQTALLTLLMKRTISSILSQGASPASQLFVYETKQIIGAVSYCSSSSESSKSNHIQKKKLNSLLFPNFKSFPKITFGLLRSSYMSSIFPNGPDGRFSQILQMRSIGIVDLVLYVYPRLLTRSNEILPLSKKVLSQYFSELPDPNNCVLIIHSCNAIFIWAKSKEILASQLSNDHVISQSDVIDVDKISDQKMKDLIKSCWMISRKYLLSFAIYGENVLDSFMVDQEINNDFYYESWRKSSNP